MKPFCYLAILFIITLNSCKSKEASSSIDIVTYPGATLPSLTERMASIEVVRLQHGDTLVVDDKARLLQRDSTFYLVDIIGAKTTYRFAQNGHFLNKIGKKGMAPEEYPTLQDIAVDEEDDSVYVFSPYRCVVTCYSKDGTFREKSEADIPAKAFNRSTNGFQMFAAYPDRTLLLQLDDSLHILDSLRLPAHFMDQKNLPVEKFTSNGNEVFFWQWPFPVVYHQTGNASPWQATFFDFGKDFLSLEDFQEGEEKLKELNAGCISTYRESDSHALIEAGIMAKDRESVQNIYGLKNKATGQWHWAEYVTTQEAPFCPDWYPTRLRGFDREGRLMCFLFGNEIEELTPEARQLVVNPEALENIDPEMDMFIFLCRLK